MTKMIARVTTTTTVRRVTADGARNQPLDLRPILAVEPNPWK
jgi:hypothetical protein